jgi:hypothetical protein
MWFNGKIVACRVFEQDLIANITQALLIGTSSPNYSSYVPEHIYWRFLRYFTDAWKYTSTRRLHLPKFVIIILVMVRGDVQG